MKKRTKSRLGGSYRRSVHDSNTSVDWQIGLSDQAQRFLDKQHLSENFVVEPLSRAARKLSGENIAIDIKRLSGKWKGFYRIRKGKIRIIFSINFHARDVFVDTIDYRGSAYK